eukprot:CAMPEP_0204383716 /NCGR_PEP_ID=MMETSP0469-20131031/56232_1 /ASSEMBLY_ACC=CAM_ASM_000384 /TAXON_ID=2969 /ORGANISM="Oxyrrhis marina" /LENGTH=41 /DNA_ID= /DNA_START= /DNA_END= /DNA_ORIENTATION=
MQSVSGGRGETWQQPGAERVADGDLAQHPEHDQQRPGLAAF